MVVQCPQGNNSNKDPKGKKNDARNTINLTTYKYYKLMCSLLYTNKKLVMKFIYFIVDATIITLLLCQFKKKNK